MPQIKAALCRVWCCVPAFKESPVLPTELVRQHLGNGNCLRSSKYRREIEQLSVKASPNAQLDLLVLDALSRWKFRSASLMAIRFSEVFAWDSALAALGAISSQLSAQRAAEN